MTAAGPAVAEPVGEVARPAALEQRSRRAGRAAARARERASSASPPAKAKANGTKPAARRDWESETAFEKWTKSSGTSISASTATAPPSTNAPQRRRAAKPGERDERERGDRDRARCGPATSAASRKWCTERDDELAAVVRERRALERLRSGCARASRRRAASARAPSSADGHDGRRERRGASAATRRSRTTA